MDIISRAMEKKLHICESINAENQTWEAFEKTGKGKKVFVFGAGNGMEYFLHNCCNYMKIESVIDNDTRKHHQKLDWYLKTGQTEYADLMIESPKLLHNYCKQEIVVLVTSVNFYLPIVHQLMEMGIEHIYILLLMEADRRKHSKASRPEDGEKVWDAYQNRCCHEKIEKNKIVMLIGVYGDHARQITKALLKRKRELDIVWLVEYPDMEKPEGVRLVCMKNTWQYLYEMETAKIWLFDDLVPDFVRKREGQIYIQVKHWSSITLKMFYLDDKASQASPKLRDVIKADGARMDYLFSGSLFDEISCQSGFGFRGKAIRVGSPRSDLLFDNAVRKNVLSRFNIREDARICLYVPTYRLEELEKTHSMSILLDLKAVLRELRAKWEGEWFLFVRIHPSLNLENGILPDSRYIVNVQDYSYSEELVAVSEVMITDYSSIMFEAAYRKKPVFLYAPDRKKFIGGERGLLIDYDTLPFPEAESDRELQQCIRGFDEKEYENRVAEFLNSYQIHEDGHAGERAADFICGLLDGLVMEREDLQDEKSQGFNAVLSQGK